MSTDTDRQFNELARMKVPAKRAAYSDRTAWTMALLAELAYERFDEESDDILMNIVGELAKLNSETDIKKRLKDFAKELAGIGRQNLASENNNQVLKAALEAGGFELAKGNPIHEPSTDTQAFVAVRREEDGRTGFVVLCFRGTQQLRDWMTNVNFETQPIQDPKGKTGIVGNMHKGFHEAYKSVEDAIADRLEGTEGLPLYITGHSLGGALAVVATWYQSSQRLAACYTFGAPRVGDDQLQGRFKTPIYRIVNAADPVPFVPPSGIFLNGLKVVVRLLGTFLNVFSVCDKLLGFLIKKQNFRHYGDMKYLPLAEPVNGEYPGIRLQPGISSVSRIWRWIRTLHISAIDKVLDTADSSSTTIKKPRPDRIDKYHMMERYRDKLRAIAIDRNA